MESTVKRLRAEQPRQEEMNGADLSRWHVWTLKHLHEATEQKNPRVEADLGCSRGLYEEKWAGAKTAVDLSHLSTLSVRWRAKRVWVTLCLQMRLEEEEGHLSHGAFQTFRGKWRVVKNKTSNLSWLLREGCAILWGEKVRYNHMPHFLDAARLRFFHLFGGRTCRAAFHL